MDRKSGAYVSPVPIPPGETLADELVARGMKQNELAKRLGMSEKTVTHIITGKAPISVETAMKLESVFDIRAGFWLELESAYQESTARKERRERFEKEVVLLKEFPIKGMVEMGWVPPQKNPVDMVAAVARFFGVASLEAVREVEGVAFRKAATKKADQYALAAWLRKGEVDGAKVEVQPYSSGKFKKALSAVRGITASLPKGFAAQVQKLCAASGVAVVYVPHIDHTHVNGAARWLSPDKALIQLSLRYNWEDIFWFSFFHEAAHILHHKTKQVYIDYKNDGENDEEVFADRWAGDFLIPPDEWKKFKTYVTSGINEGLINDWGKRLGVSRGIIIGRLQHEKMLAYNRMNHLRKKFIFVDG